MEINELEKKIKKFLDNVAHRLILEHLDIKEAYKIEDYFTIKRDIFIKVKFLSTDEIKFVVITSVNGKIKVGLV